ncbi:TetR/AcrR family transcriptional regulator C-terminal domain-containing protein [Leifsonia sp. ZF2019]|uniref:TetR family transcriptional regulator n=1 Tax=Leifsonia sp. ZF2019 TaxID=2781978 RepID=UPI001CBDCC48|nr:TetR/AcrR family transcriptional regulator C-terminal domain-containing protein [Leifsonia sp. ZF2019]UAJ78844.1 TetR/AcrR family transcriptional regulator C-terminal domain-containing protein [Leifsonia sp. ZF2019]
MERDEIVEEAVALLDEGGYDAVTMRALATRLQVSAPSLYWHFPSKQELWEGIADALVEGVVAIPADEADPDERLLALLADFRSALVRHRDGGRVFAGTFTLGRHMLDLSETATSRLLEAGILDAGDAVDAWFNLVRFTIGSVIEQQAAADQLDDLTSRRAAFENATRARPALRAATDRLFAPDEERRFDQGARHLLAGAKASARA